MELQDAVECLCKHLKSNDDYRYSWQSNIAVAFQDAMKLAGYQLPDLHKVSNDAAKNFLSNLLSVEKKSQPKIKPIYTHVTDELGVWECRKCGMILTDDHVWDTFLRPLKCSGCGCDIDWEN